MVSAWILKLRYVIQVTENRKKHSLPAPSLPPVGIGYLSVAYGECGFTDDMGVRGFLPQHLSGVATCSVGCSPYRSSVSYVGS